MTKEPEQIEKENISKIKLEPKQKKISEPTKLDERLVYFILLIFGISSGEVAPTDLLKSAGSWTQYGYYSKTIMDVYNLGVKWKYGLARASEMISVKVKLEDFKLFLMKLAQVLRLGEDLREFFKHEMDAMLNAYLAAYERTMRSMELLLGMYSTIMSTSSFMMSAMLILTMLSGGAGGIDMVIGSTAAILGGLSAFVLLSYMFFPRNPVTTGEPTPKLLKFKKRLYMCIGLSVALGLGVSLSGLVPPILGVAISGGPLILPGMMARKIDGEIKKLDDYYPSFVRHLGDIYNTVGSVGQSLKSVLRSDFGTLNPHLEAMSNRVKSRITIGDAFEQLSRETGSALITGGNTVLSSSIVNGANMLVVGGTLSDISRIFLEARKKREQFSKSFESTIFILHILTLMIFSLINGLMGFLNSFFATQSAVTESASAVLSVGALDPGTMGILMSSVALALSGINAMAIKVSQGGLYQTVWFSTGILLIISGVVMYSVEGFLSQMLGEMLDIGETVEGIGR